MPNYTLEQVGDMVTQVIADAERYKRERDEAVGLIQEHVENLGWEFSDFPMAISAKSFLARIEQADGLAADLARLDEFRSIGDHIYEMKAAMARSVKPDDSEAPHDPA